MGLSRMRGNSLVRFFEGKAAVTTLTYSDGELQSLKAFKNLPRLIKRRKNP